MVQPPPLLQAAVEQANAELVEPPIVGLGVTLGQSTSLWQRGLAFGLATLAIIGDALRQVLLSLPVWSGSLLLHLALVLSLAVLTWPEQQPHGSPVVLALSTDDVAIESDAELELPVEIAPPLATPVVADWATPSSALPGELSEALPAANEQSTEQTIVLTDLLVQSTDDQPVRRASKAARAGKNGTAGQGTDLTNGQPFPFAKATTSFYGVPAVGESFCFVVDSSSSMRGPKFERTIKELVYAIEKLEPEQKFYVIFFSDGAYPLFFPTPAKDLVFATPANKQLCIEWLAKVELRGRTRGSVAMDIAFRLQPDVIFLLGDGQFGDNTVLETLRRRTNKTKIHTIGINLLPNGPEEQAFTTIAKAFAGAYRNVPVVE